MSSSVVIVAAKRTPIGNFNGGLAAVPAHNLAATVIKDLLAGTGVQAADVSEVILGQVLSAGQGQNPARQASMAAGLPDSVPAMGVNMVCGSGLRAVQLGAQAIMTGDSCIVVAGGMESMSLSRHAVHARAGVKFGDVSLEDTMLKDGLTDAFNNYHMGMTAENVAKKFNISRAEQDEFSVRSQQKAGVAMTEGRFKEEIVQVTVPGRKADVIVNTDEFPKPETNVDGLAKLRPAFQRDGTGSVTAGNASGINDGAAAVLLMTAEEAAKRGLTPLCRVVAAATAGVDPAVMGTGPIPAVRAAVGKAGWSLDEIDLFELNEAFAAQAIAVQRELGVPDAKVNVNGGSIALGHPIGASGCRVLVTLIHALKQASGKKGCAALCIGGGMGIAMCVEML
eukprot:TRINITY_DN16859_c0_g1_i2.p1 TRINITY_DN16859_c0_g1~~TRINITY_DN16859_c0_g1_i2.p1  ORF type:complete len:414 (+),score=97.77 TRINITY_DN16859_c0_g1_i2:59-1243(+)